MVLWSAGWDVNRTSGGQLLLTYPVSNLEKSLKFSGLLPREIIDVSFVIVRA